MSEICAVCTLHDLNPGTGFAAYACDEALRDRVADVLSTQGFAHTVHSDIFVFQSDALALLREHLSEGEQANLRVGRCTLKGLMGAQPLGKFTENMSTEWFDEALENDRFTYYFQPIVNVSRGTVFAHECLIRLNAGKFYQGAEIMDAAFARGRLRTFDSYCRCKAIRSGATVAQPGTRLFVNFLASSIYDPVRCLQSTIDALEQTRLTPADVVFEVVESDEIKSVKHLEQIRDYLKERGFGFALDDVGSGSNSLQTVCTFRPDYIKLDKSLTDGIEDRMKATAVRKIVELAMDFGVSVIAEGVETAEAAAILKNSGIDLMQGFFFGRPGPTMMSSPDDLARLAEGIEAASRIGIAPWPALSSVSRAN